MDNAPLIPMKDADASRLPSTEPGDTDNRASLPAAILQSREILVSSLDSGFKFLRLAAVLACLAILFSGVKIVNPQEVAIVLRFGKIVGQTRAEQIHGPGLLLAFPYLIDQVVRVPVKQVQELRVTTFAAVPDSTGPIPAPTAADDLASHPDPTPAAADDTQDATPTPTSEASDATSATASADDSQTLDPAVSGYIVTGNKNVVHTTVLVKYTISDPIDYALYASDPDSFINDAVSEALTQTIGVTGVDSALTDGKRRIVVMALNRAQRSLDEIDAGVSLNALEIQELRPPDALKADFDAVTTAYVGMQTALQQARTYTASTVPAAQAARDAAISQAEAFAASRVARANGDTSVFRSVVAQYKANPGVVKERLYREAMDDVMAKVGSTVLVPYGKSQPRILLPANIAPGPIPRESGTPAPTQTPAPESSPPAPDMSGTPAPADSNASPTPTGPDDTGE